MWGLNKIKIITDEKQIDEIISRGVENIFPNKEYLKSRMMKGERLTLYLGIDPTGPTLHMGHVIPLLKLAKFQKLGHQIILLMGDFTAMIGDPTDKTATRKKLTRDEVLKNLDGYKKQASKFISFSGPNKALFKFNSEWLGKMSFGDVLELASNFTVQQMLERDMFQNRVKEGKPVYLHEFLYPLMQGYDSVAMDVNGEIGGNDQTFNMLAGRDLLKTLKNKEKFVITAKLLVDSSGKKMGKTENNMVALNQSADEMFGKVMSWSDDLIIPGFEIVTEIPLSEINQIKDAISGGENPRNHKVRLAVEMVKMYHGEKMANDAKLNFENTFSKGGIPDDVVEISVATGTKLVDVLLEQQTVISKNEYRRLVSEGAVLNMNTDKKVDDVDGLVEDGVYKVGKRRFIKIKVL